MRSINYFISIFLPYAAAVAVAIFISVEPGSAEIFPLVPLFALIASFPPLVLIYRMWSAVKHPGVSTSPGMAVAGLFVPLFNIYWSFRVWAGWPRAFSECAKHAGKEVRPISAGPFVAMVLTSYAGPLFLLAALPFTQARSTEDLALTLLGSAVLMSLTSLVLFVIVVSRTCRGVNELARAQSELVPEVG